MLLVSSRYFIGEKQDMLLTNVRQAAIATQTAMDRSTEHWADEAKDSLKTFTLTANANFFITDANGRVLVYSVNGGSYGQQISGSALADFDDKGEYEFTDLDHFFNANYHTVGLKFQYYSSTYYIFAAASESEQDDYIWNIMEIYALSCAIAYIIVIVLVYLTTLNLTSPIKEMAKTAKRIGQGNFDERVPLYDITEYRELASALNDMAVSIKNYDIMRSSFVANVSHELRTPMTSIGGFVDGMIDGTIPRAEQKKYLRIVSDEVHRLTRLVRSMLNLAKIESGTMQLTGEFFSILEPIVHTLETFTARLEEKHIEIEGLDGDRVIVFADNDLVHQVVYNLLENAIKFVNDGGKISFSFRHIENFVEISIKNSGDGLGETELPLVFDRFYKTDESRGKDKNGVGLGLNIVKSIIKLHNGKIMVRSIRNEYTEFVFTLPANPPEEA
ncbi:MAG: HAMP domain-containing sensor histidine kinase [Oscillospiraceae bacterium]